MLARAFHDDPAWRVDPAARRAPAGGAAAVALPDGDRVDARRRPASDDDRRRVRGVALLDARRARPLAVDARGRCAALRGDAAPPARRVRPLPRPTTRAVRRRAATRACPARRWYLSGLGVEPADAAARDRQRAARRRASTRASATACPRVLLTNSGARTSRFYRAARLRDRARRADRRSGLPTAGRWCGSPALDSRRMPLPKRFPDRDEIADVRAEAEPLEPGAEARRDAAPRRPRAWRAATWGSSSSSTSSTARAGSSCSAPRERTGEVDVDLGDIVGVDGRAAEDAARRAVADRRRARAAREDPPAAARTPSTASPTSSALPPALPRPADERGDARATSCCARGWSPRSAATSTSDGFVEVETPILQPRYGGAFAEPFVTHSQRARPRPLPADRDRALPQAPDRRRAREGLRARQGLPQRGRLVQAQARVHDARVVRGVRGLPRHDGADRGARRARSRRRRSARRRSTFRGHEIDLKPPWRRVSFVDALEEHGLWTRDDGRAAREARARAASTRRRTRPGRSSSTTRSRTSSSRA